MFTSHITFFIASSYTSTIFTYTHIFFALHFFVTTHCIYSHLTLVSGSCFKTMGLQSHTLRLQELQTYAHTPPPLRLCISTVYVGIVPLPPSFIFVVDYVGTLRIDFGDHSLTCNSHTTSTVDATHRCRDSLLLSWLELTWWGVGTLVPTPAGTLRVEGMGFWALMLFEVSWTLSSICLFIVLLFFQQT